MFSSCCRCVNKKALKEQTSENENEIDDDERPKSPNGTNNSGAAHTASDDDDGYASRNELDTTLKVIIEENDNDPETAPAGGSCDNAKNKSVSVSSDNVTGVGVDNNKNEQQLNQQQPGCLEPPGENESVGAIVNNACNISDEEKQKMLGKQHSGSSDNEDSGTVEQFSILFYSLYK